MKYIKKNKKSIIQIKNCAICEHEFKTYNKNKKCCSYSCARIKTWQNPVYQNRIHP